MPIALLPPLHFRSVSNFVSSTGSHSNLLKSLHSHFANMMGDDDYFLPFRIIERLQVKLQDRAKPSFKSWFSGHLKNVGQVRGVPMQEIRFAVSKWNSEWQLEQQSVPGELQISVSLLLLKSNFIEDQLASIIFLDDILIPNSVVTPSTLPQFEQLISTGYITNFKVCDNFSSKVLRPLILRYGTAVTDTLARWFDAPSTWQARSALGSFASFANDAIYDDLILTGCDKLVRRREEDAKNVVGSALKALGKRNFGLVEEFLSVDVHLACINANGLKKACEPLPAGDDRSIEFRSKRRQLQQQGVGTQAELETQQRLEAARIREEQGGMSAGGESSTQHEPQETQEEQGQPGASGASVWQSDIGILEEDLGGEGPSDEDTERQG